MPFIDFTDPLIILVALIVFVFLWILSHVSKSNTAPCIELFAYLLILVTYTVEMITHSTDANLVVTLSECIAVNEIFIFVTFLNLLWADRLQLEKEKKAESKGKGKVEKNYEDGLDVLFKKV